MYDILFELCKHIDTLLLLMIFRPFLLQAKMGAVAFLCYDNFSVFGPSVFIDRKKNNLASSKIGLQEKRPSTKSGLFFFFSPRLVCRFKLISSYEFFCLFICYSDQMCLRAGFNSVSWEGSLLGVSIKSSLVSFDSLFLKKCLSGIHRYRT